MGYEQFHAYLTAMLLAGQLSNPNLTRGDSYEISSLEQATENSVTLAANILKRCGFVRMKAQGGGR
jgi:hypothetical protein